MLHYIEQLSATVWLHYQVIK